MSTRKRTPDPDPWDRWLVRYLKRLQASGHAPKTIVSRKDMIGRFIAYSKQAGLQGPEAIGTSLLRAYLLYRRETINSRGRRDRPRTLNSHLLALRRFLEFLSKEGLVPASLVEAVEYVKNPQSLPRDIPTHQEVEKMLHVMDLSMSTGFRDRVILELVYSTGMRRQELLDLKVGDVDLAQGYVLIERGKGGKGRVVPLGRVAGDWVKKYLLAIRSELLRGRPDPGWLFVTREGKKLDGESIRQMVMRSAKLAGVQKNVTPHALRRACATEMIRNNANPYYVKELLGHEDFRSLDVYAKLTILDLKAAHKKHHPREKNGPSES